jgi:hypothetical protein
VIMPSGIHPEAQILGQNKGSHGLPPYHNAPELIGARRRGETRMKRTHLLQRGKARVAQILCMMVLVAYPLTSQADPLAVGTRAGQGRTNMAAAFKVYKDPVTGQITKPPIEIHPDHAAALRRALSTSSEGLVASPSLGGGIRVDLQGRFRHTTTVTRDDTGALSGQCDSHISSQP